MTSPRDCARTAGAAKTIAIVRRSDWPWLRLPGFNAGAARALHAAATIPDKNELLVYRGVELRQRLGRGFISPDLT